MDPTRNMTMELENKLPVHNYKTITIEINEGKSVFGNILNIGIYK